MNGNTKQALFLDWLTIYGIRLEPIQLADRYKADGDPKSSMYFKRVQKVMLLLDGRWQALGVLCEEPSTPKMNVNTISFKFANHILYRSDYYDIIIDTLRDFHISCPHIARIDVAVDFLQLACGLSGLQLAQQLADGRAIRKGSRKMSVHGKSPYRILDDGVLVRAGGGIESVTFGTHASVCQFQLYNKTEELRQSSMGGYCPKEYIRSCWKQAGVYSPDADTWRLELRLSSKAHSIVNLQTGQLEPIGIYQLRPEGLQLAIRAIVAKWAEIRSTRRASQHDLQHFSRLRRIELLEFSGDCTIVPRCKPVREGLPASAYIKGVMSTIERFRTDFLHLLPDPTDRYILGDALSAIRCIYSEARSAEREAEVRAFLAGASFDMMEIIDMSPQMSKSEEHYFSWIKGLEQYYKLHPNQQNRNPYADY